MRFKILNIFLIVVLFYYNLFSRDQIKKWNNQIIEEENFKFNGNYFLFKDHIIDKNEVSYIKFNIVNIENKNFQNLLGNNITAEELIKRANLLEKKYNDVKKLVLLDEGIEKLNKDGSQYTRSRYAIKIMNEKELDEAILSFYHIPGDYETKIIFARSISKDGKISYLSESDIKFTTPTQDLKYFSGKRDTKIMKAIIPDVKVGSIIDFEWETIKFSPEDKNQFYAKWWFGGEDPFFESKVQFIIPEEKEFYWVTKNFGEYNPDPEIKVKEGYKIYSFYRGESPNFNSEPLSPPMYELLPFVVGSLHKDQKYLSEWLSKFFKERMIYDKKIEETVKEIINKKNAKTEEEKVAVLYRFVQEYIFYRSIKTTISSGMAGHPATETFYNKYGDCIDKSIFFATILGIAGIEAYPVIVTTNDEQKSLIGEIGILSGNHAINEIHLKENQKRIIYLDSTSSTYKYPNFRSDNHGIKAWNPILNTINYIEPYSVENNTQSYNFEIIFNSDGSGEITKNNIYKGEYDADFREYFISLKPKEIDLLFISSANRDFPGSKILEYNYLNPTDYDKDFYIYYKFQARNIVKKINEYLVFNIPINYNFNGIHLDSRKYPLKYETRYGEKHKITVKIPEGYKIKGIPKNITLNNKNVSYQATYSLKENSLIFEDYFKREAIEVLPQDYPEYKKLLLEIDYFTKIPIIFEKNN